MGPVNVQPLQVKRFRELMQLPASDLGVMSVDCWGIKKLFTFALRRWLAGSVTPRDLRL